MTGRTSNAGQRATRVQCGLRALRVLSCGGLCLALTAAPAYAHAYLTRSTPAADATLTAPPAAIHLWFSEPLELSLTRIILRGPDGTAVPLRPVVGDAASRLSVTTAVSSVLVPGRYTVEWHVVAADGHPSHGTFTFTFALAGAPSPGGTGGSPTIRAAGHAPAGRESPASAQGQEPPTAAAGAVHNGSRLRAASATFDVGSPPYAIVRWALYLGMVGLIGAVVFFWFVLGRLPKQPQAVVANTARARAATLGAAAATLVLVASVARLVAQSAVMQSAMGEPASPAAALTHRASLAMVLGTAWGHVWWLQIAATLVALGAVIVARTRVRYQATPGAPGSAEPISRVPWLVAALATVTLALTPALSGHAAAVTSWAGLAIIADTVHLLAAGGWLGTLFAVLIVGIPRAIRLPVGIRGPAVAALVNAFSPVALVAAGVLTLTGTYAAIVHVGTISALWGTEYGRVLLLKLAVLTPVAFTGFYNWRVVRPRLGADSGIVRIRRSASAELLVGALVIAVTAVLVATPTPERKQDEASMPPVVATPARMIP